MVPDESSTGWKNLIGHFVHMEPFNISLTNQVEFYLFQRFNHLSLRRAQLKPIQNGVFQLSYQEFMGHATTPLGGQCVHTTLINFSTVPAQYLNSILAINLMNGWESKCLYGGSLWTKPLNARIFNRSKICTLLGERPRYNFLTCLMKYPLSMCEFIVVAPGPQSEHDSGI